MRGRREREQTNPNTPARLRGRGFEGDGAGLGGQGRATVSRKGAVPGLDPPPTCSGASSRDVIPTG